MYMSSLSHIDSGTVILIALFAVFFTVALIISSPVLLIVALVALLICIYFPQYRALVVGFLAILFSLPLYVIISILPLDPTLRVFLQIAAYAVLLFMTFYYIVKEYEKVRRVRAIIK
jgi:4-hydroxybenzoate polyprenyltransferase